MYRSGRIFPGKKATCHEIAGANQEGVADLSVSLDQIMVR